MARKSHDADLQRRQCFQMAFGGLSAAALGALMTPAQALAAAAESETLAWAECLKLSPLEMAERSRIVNSANQFLQASARAIHDPALREAAGAILANPAPTLLELYHSEGDKEATRQELIAQKLLVPAVTVAQLFPPAPSSTQPAQSFLVTPGSVYAGHHAYPGGLNLHVGLNVRSSLGIYNGYRDNFGFELDHDVVLASQLLHDLHKPWVYQWQADGSLLAEQTVAGTGAHHILSIAECIHRNLPPAMIVALACAHDHPGTPEDEAKPVGYLRAAAILAKRDPVALGLLAPDGKTLPLPRRIEGFVTHLGDHDWIIAGPVNAWNLVLLKDIARRDYKMSDADLSGAPFNALRNYVFSQTSMLGLHSLNVTQGPEAVRSLVHHLVVPA